MTSDSPRLTLLLTGRIRQHVDERGSRWRSGIEKRPAAGPVALGLLGLEGDEQAAKKWHGGPDRPLLAYAAAHYGLWRAEETAAGREPLAPGAFGENLLVEGLDETAVAIGDAWAVLREGRAEPVAVLQVSQPRVPCATPGRRWARPELQERMAGSGRTGWYLRVLQAGSLAAGDRLELRERPHPDWTIARAWELARDKERDAARWAELRALPELAALWKE